MSFHVAIPSNTARLELFRQLAALLEKIMPEGWFDNPKHQGHPAYHRWAFCQKMIAQQGIFRFPEQKAQLPLFGQLLLDTHFLQVVMGDYFDQLLEPVKVKISHYLMHPTQFDDVLLEIAYAAYHLMAKHQAELLEIEHHPDIRVYVPEVALPVYVECKNIMTDNDNSFRHIITHANGQLKKVSEPHYGLVVLNIAKPIKIQRVTADALPQRVDEIIQLVKRCLTGKKHRSVGAALLIWDDYMQLGDIPPRLLLAYRRRSVRIDHSPEEGCRAIPENVELFTGATAEFIINSQPEDLPLMHNFQKTT